MNDSNHPRDTELPPTEPPASSGRDAGPNVENRKQRAADAAQSAEPIDSFATVDPLVTINPLPTSEPSPTSDLHSTVALGAIVDRQDAGQPGPEDLPSFAFTLPESQQSEIDRWCSEFKSAWHLGSVEPSVEDFAPVDLEPQLREVLIHQLVLMDIDFRERHDISLSPDIYLSRLPGYEQAVRSAWSKRRSRRPGEHDGSAARSRTVASRSRSVPLPPPDPGSRYLPTRLHARGGLGAVFRARDRELKRTVALKEILPDHANNPRCQERFVFEAEITGALEHPGIVPVYGLGRHPDQRPYYAMRFIRGRSLRAVIGEFHQQHASLSAGVYLDRQFRGLLRRLIEACNAIHYAHQHGVLHRDIKPDNIMVGDYGETLVVDWGLARLIASSSDRSVPTDSTRIEVTGSGTQTSQGSAIGTPMYMSPEQAMGLHDQLDGRADVYSLGAVLFNIVTGQHPVEGSSGREVVTNVREGKIRNLRAVTPAAPAALASICKKAMASDRGGRYQSPVELAEDLDRWMSDELVLAHADQERLTERAGRLIRRYRSWTISGAAALLTVATVAVLAALLIQNARTREEQAKLEAIRSKQDAVRRYRDSREAIDTWLVQSGDTLKYFPGTQSLRQRLLQIATEDYKDLADRESDDPELEFERGRALVKLGDLLRRQEDHPGAAESYAQAQRLLEVLRDSADFGPAVRVELGTLHSKTALAAAGIGNLADAQRQFDQAIGELGELVAVSDRPAARRALAAAHVNAGRLKSLLDPPEAGLDHLRIAAEQYRLLAKPRQPADTLGLAKTHQLAGEIHAQLDAHRDAVKEYRQAVAALSPLVEAEPDQPEYLDALAETQVAMAASYRRMGHETDQFSSLTAAVRSYRALREAMPDVPRYRENVAIALTDLGIAYHEAGSNQRARLALTEAAERLTDLVDAYGQVPRFRAQLAGCDDALGLVQLDSNQTPEVAVQTLQGAVTRYQDLLARSQQSRSDFEAVNPDELSRLRSDYIAGWAIAQSHYARALRRNGQDQAAETYFRGAIDLLQQLIERRELPRLVDALAHTHRHYAELLWQLDRAEASEQFLAARDRWLEIGPERSAPYSGHLAWLLATCPDPTVRDPAAAAQYAKQAVDRAEENPRLRTVDALASVLNGDVDRGLEQLRRARDSRGEWVDREYFVLALAELEQGDPASAEQALRAGDRWREENRPFNSDSDRLREMVAAQLVKQGE